MRNSRLIGAAVAFVILLVHWSPWKYFLDVAPVPEMIFTKNGGHYFTIEREFWTCVLTSITCILAIDGFAKARAENSDEAPV